MQITIIFLAVLCLAGGICALLLFWSGKRHHDVEARLNHIVAPNNGDRRRQARFARLPDLTQFLPEIARNRLYQAGIEVKEDRAAVPLVSVLGAVVASGFAFGISAALLILVSMILIVAAIVDYRARKRMDALSDAMLGYFDRVRQLLVVGNSLSVALARATHSSPPIVLEFFQPTIRRIANGAGVAESMGQLARELELYELRLFAAAIETNLRFGGSLTAILANLIENIRRRAAVMREVRVNTSQIRASAWVLGLLPLLVATVVFTKSPEYMRWFIDNPAGRQLVVYCMVSQVLGALLMRKVVRSGHY